MTAALLQLTPSELSSLAAAIRSNRLSFPIAPASLRQWLPIAATNSSATALNRLAANGCSPPALAATLDLLALAQERTGAVESAVQLVATGPEVAGVSLRDTSVVVQDLFRRAERSVIVAGYALYNARPIFQALADRMVAVEGLSVRLIVDIRRQSSDTSHESEILARYRTDFLKHHWPKDYPQPEVYYDPRSLDSMAAGSSVMHAKCVAIDSSEVFASSANFTEAAHVRNIEVGVRIVSRAVAAQLERFWTALLQNYLRRLPLGDRGQRR